jgi:putative ABC transport system permease protein
MVAMRLLSGRWLAEDEPIGAVVINETLARTQFAGRDPIGVRIRAPSPGAARYAPIVGIVADMRYAKVDADVGPEMFVHYGMTSLFGITLMARTDGDPLAVASEARRVVTAVDPTQSIYNVQTMEQSMLASIAPRRFNVMLLVSFAVLALLLSLLGLYGVVTYAVAERTNEIGVRIALGAQRARVVRMVVREGMTSAMAGVVVGLAAAFALSRVMTDLVYGVDARDIPTFVTVTTILMAIAFISCVIPALKAAVVDPVIALRAE